MGDSTTLDPSLIEAGDWVRIERRYEFLDQTDSWEGFVVSTDFLVREPLGVFDAGSKGLRAARFEEVVEHRPRVYASDSPVVPAQAEAEAEIARLREIVAADAHEMERLRGYAMESDRERDQARTERDALRAAQASERAVIPSVERWATSPVNAEKSGAVEGNRPAEFWHGYNAAKEDALSWIRYDQNNAADPAQDAPQQPMDDLRAIDYEALTAALAAKTHITAQYRSLNSGDAKDIVRVVAPFLADAVLREIAVPTDNGLRTALAAERVRSTALAARVAALEAGVNTSQPSAVPAPVLSERTKEREMETTTCNPPHHTIACYAEGKRGPECDLGVTPLESMSAEIVEHPNDHCFPGCGHKRVDEQQSVTDDEIAQAASDHEDGFQFGALEAFIDGARWYQQRLRALSAVPSEAPDRG